VSNFAGLLDKYNAGLKYFDVIPFNKVIAEDGKYLSGEFVGYAVFNTETKVVEHTNICLAATMFQANHFDDMLTSLLEGTPALSIVGDSAEDIVPPTELN